VRDNLLPSRLRVLLEKFGGLDGLSALVGKKIQVTGEIYVNQFELKGEIECKDPAQIAVVME